MEMLPLVDRPLIQYAVEEARAAGIEDIVIVTGRGKGTIEDHFDCAVELEDSLRRNGKRGALAAIEDSCPRSGTIAYIRQQQPLGLTHALWCARHFVGREPFAVLLPDEVFLAKAPCLAQMATAYRRVGGNLVAVMPASRGHATRHGAIVGRRRDDGLLAASGVDVRPASRAEPTRWAAVGRYIFDATTIDCLDPAGSLAFADVLTRCIADGALHGYAFAGRHFDCSDALGLFEANIAFTLARTEFAPTARNLLVRYAHLASDANRLEPADSTALRVPA